MDIVAKKQKQVCWPCGLLLHVRKSPATARWKAPAGDAGDKLNGGFKMKLRSLLCMCLAAIGLTALNVHATDRSTTQLKGDIDSILQTGANWRAATPAPTSAPAPKCRGMIVIDEQVIK
jgi:hypothetical protein